MPRAGVTLIAYLPLASGALIGLIQQDGVLPIPGAKNAHQAAANAGALTFELTPEEVDMR